MFLLEEEVDKSIEIINNQIENISEALFIGKSKELLECEKLIQTLIIKNKNGSKLNTCIQLTQLEKILADYFNTEKVNIVIRYEEMGYNMLTIPLYMTGKELFNEENKDNFVVNNTKFANKKGKSIVILSSSDNFDGTFTNKEILAAIIHEIGHSMIMKNDKMTNLFSYLNDIVEIYRRLDIINIAKEALPNYEDYINNINNRKNPIEFDNIKDTYEKLKKISETDIKFMSSSIILSGLILRTTNLINYFASYISNKKEENKNLFSSLDFIHNLAGRIYNFVMKFLHAIGFINFIYKLFVDLNTAKNILLQNAYTNLRPTTLGINMIRRFFFRSHEQFADSFATIHGYGPDLSSFLLKIRNSSNDIETFINKIPIVNGIFSLLTLPSYFSGLFTDSHGSSSSRTIDSLILLKQELKKEDLDPKTKTEINNNIERLETLIKEYSSINVEIGKLSSTNTNFNSMIQALELSMRYKLEGRRGEELTRGFLSRRSKNDFTYKGIFKEV